MGYQRKNKGAHLWGARIRYKVNISHLFIGKSRFHFHLWFLLVLKYLYCRWFIGLLMCVCVWKYVNEGNSVNRVLCGILYGMLYRLRRINSLSTISASAEVHSHSVHVATVCWLWVSLSITIVVANQCTSIRWTSLFELCTGSCRLILAIDDWYVCGWVQIAEFNESPIRSWRLDLRLVYCLENFCL